MRDTSGTRRALATLDSLLPFTGRQQTSLTVQSRWLHAAAAQAQAQSDVAASLLQEAAQIATARLGPNHRLSKLAVFRVGEFAKMRAALAAKRGTGKGS